MAISVGIHNNVSISAVKKNDKGTLVIQFKKGVKLTAKQRLSRATIDSSADNATQDFVIFPVNFTSFDGGAKSVADVSKEFYEMQDMLTYIVSQYKPVAEINWDIVKGITEQEIESDKIFSDEKIHAKLYANLVDGFIAQMAPFAKEGGKDFRVIFPRSSKKSNFPSLRRKYLTSYGFMEPMTVPAEASSLKYSKYELENGFDKSEALASDKSVDTAKVKADAAKFASVFNKTTAPSI